MSMIPCDRECTNQREGYCFLENIVSPPEDAVAMEAGCLYFVARECAPGVCIRREPPIW